MRLVPSPEPPASPASAVSAPPPATGGPSGLAAARGGVDLSIPLPYLLAGSIASGLFGLLLPFVAPEALATPLLPHVLALVHLATLGWLTMTILGASLQLAPVILNAPLRAGRFLRWQFPVYSVGVTLLVVGFIQLVVPLMAIGGALVVLATFHYAIVLAATLAGAKSRPLTARYLAAALVYLCIVVCLGLTAALNLRFGFLGDAQLRLLRAHVALALVGWLSTTLIGVSYTLVRLFALAHGHNDTLGRRVFVALNAGVAGLAVGLALNWTPLVLVGGLALAGALWLFAFDYLRMLRSRKRKVLDMTQRHAIAGVAYLTLGVSLALGATLTGNVRPPQVVALGLLALVGALGQSIVGYLYKIVPFLIWHSRYAARIGKTDVPLMRELISPRLATASFWLINLSLPVAACAAALSWIPALQIASVALGVGLALATVNIVRAVLPC